MVKHHLNALHVLVSSWVAFGCSGMSDTILEDGDTIVFISTMHGG